MHFKKELKMKNLRKISGSLIIGLILLLCAGCDYEDFLLPDEEILLKNKLRVWRETPEGVRYFTSCAEGFLFIATPSTHDKIQMAGPIGDCT